MVKLEKHKIREEVLAKRRMMREEEVLEKSKKIWEQLFNKEELKRANNVLVYLSFDNEVDTFEGIKELIAMGKNVFVPKVIDGEIRVVEFKIFDDLSKNQWGILEPLNNNFINNLEDLEVVIVPGIAFDDQGNRIGYGRGFYDKFLKTVSVYKIGLGFNFQIMQNFHVDQHDVAMDNVLGNTI